jgi:hypothetical protein
VVELSLNEGKALGSAEGKGKREKLSILFIVFDWKFDINVRKSESA